MDILRAYIKQCKPRPLIYVFEGMKPGKEYSPRSAQQVFHNARQKARIKKDITFHGLGHSFATHLLVIEYLGRYTHKVAISNHRISGIDDERGTVTFDYKDYADESKKNRMILSASEFIRRFEQHILPERFTKKRTYGYLSNRNRHQRINEVLKKMKLPIHNGLVRIP